MISELIFVDFSSSVFNQYVDLINMRICVLWKPYNATSLLKIIGGKTALSISLSPYKYGCCLTQIAF